jgi:hypothetical protein
VKSSVNPMIVAVNVMSVDHASKSSALTAAPCPNSAKTLATRHKAVAAQSPLAVHNQIAHHNLVAATTNSKNSKKKYFICYMTLQNRLTIKWVCSQIL